MTEPQDPAPPAGQPGGWGGAPPPQQPYSGQPGGAPPPYGGQQQPYGGQPCSPPPPGYLSPQDERTWGLFAHIGAILAGILCLAFLGPLLVMLIQGPKSAFVRRHAVESLNFQITLVIASIVGAVAAVILAIITLGIALLVIVPAAILLGIAALVLIVVAGVKANNGEDFRYPVNLRLVK